MRRNTTHLILLATVAAALGLALAVDALAATPKPGTTFKGFTSVGAYNGYRATVSFKVSADGKQLLAFKWQAGGCIGMGGPGNAYADPYNNYLVGTMPVSAPGTFSVKNVKWVGTSQTPHKTTLSTVSGRFTSATTASGTIHYTQTDASGAGPCSGVTTFTAKMK